MPYDRTNPILYDNDEAVDMYTDEYLLAQASLGHIQLKGMMTSTPNEPYDFYVTRADFERCVSDREQLVSAARNSGFLNVPNPFAVQLGD